MNKIFLLVLSVILFCLCSTSCKVKTEDEQILRAACKLYKGKCIKIETKIKGNYTNSGFDEYLIIAVWETVYHKSKSYFNDQFIIVFDKNNKQPIVYKLPFTNMPPPDDGFIKEKDKFSKTLNDGIIYDFNQNGIEEFIVYEVAGSVYEFGIIEFKEGKFQLICQNYNPELNIPGLYNYDLDHFDFETKSMYLSERPKGKKIKLTWNPETEFYDKEVLSE